jgi:hypothetical protein
MASTYKILGQILPVVDIDTTLYTVPASANCVTSTISICNRATTPATYRIALRPAGVTLANTHYLAYDAAISPSDTAMITAGISLEGTDVITVRANNSNTVFQVFGVEIT